MRNWVKVFEFDDDQVMVMKDTMPENGLPCVVTMIQRKDRIMRAWNPHRDAENRDKAFEIYDEAYARKMLKAALELELDYQGEIGSQYSTIGIREVPR